MKIIRVQIRNYRNLRGVDVPLDNLAALVGENNSGKTNFMKAMALPLSSEDGDGKRLTWFDINDEAKAAYYEFIEKNRGSIIDNTVDVGLFCEAVPSVEVCLDFKGNDTEGYDLKDLLVGDASGEIVARIVYRWFVKAPEELLELIGGLLAEEPDIHKIRMSLLPMDLYRYEIVVPDKNDSHRVPYEVLSRFRFVLLSAERDGFAASSNRLGSHALASLLKDDLTPTAIKNIELEYGKFVDTMRKEAKLDQVLNWQDYTDVPNAKDFFSAISVLPNMPTMTSILGGIQLGYGEENLFLQGLGNRNLILMAVLLNAYLGDLSNLSLKTLFVEEPEAHLCVNNVLLMASFLRVLGSKDDRSQLIYSTHDPELVNKMGLDKVIVLHSGRALSLKNELGPSDLDYLARNPNTDIMKLLFSHRLILVEGITEELLIKAYLQTRRELSDIKVLSFHKGYKDIIRIWKANNKGNGNRLGIVRDFDNQEKAKTEHEALADEQVCVRTTKAYTLETDIVETGANHKLLKDKYGALFGWTDMTEDQLQADWRERRKTDVMLKVSHDLLSGELADFKMPSHIQDILDFLTEPAPAKLNPEA